VDVDPDTPLLWVLRDTLGLTGTRYGCSIALCGACTVHIDGVATRSCSAPVGAVEGSAITTIEGLSANGELHPVQKAWIAHDVPQCGYCQSGMIMAVAEREAAGERRRHRLGDHQHLPLRHLCADPSGDPYCGDRVTRRRWS
jgi:aerobic-type carbon monoxide dehydrogenase small subunit (CoxS/CutS family)